MEDHLSEHGLCDNCRRAAAPTDTEEDPQPSEGAQCQGDQGSSMTRNVLIGAAIGAGVLGGGALFAGGGARGRRRGLMNFGRNARGGGSRFFSGAGARADAMEIANLGPGPSH